MKQIERKDKIEAILKLLKFSLLFPETQKKNIVKNLTSFSDDMIDNFGSILSYEHFNRDKLDDLFVKDFLKYLVGFKASSKK